MAPKKRGSRPIAPSAAAPGRHGANGKGAGLVVWRTDPGLKYCVLGGLLNVPSKARIARGLSGADGFPRDAQFKMTKECPRQVALSDALENFGGMAVVGSALKDFVMAHSPKSVEALPVRVINHKGRDAGAEFWILNPLATVDCIDQGASQVIWNAIDPTQICGFKKFVLTDAAIPPDLLLFRPKFLEQRVIVRRELADAIRAKGFTGLSFAEADTFMG